MAEGVFAPARAGGCDGELVVGGWSPGGDGWSPAVFSVRRRYPVAKMTRVWHENATSYIFCTYNASGGRKRSHLPLVGADVVTDTTAAQGRATNMVRHRSRGPVNSTWRVVAESRAAVLFGAMPIIGPNHRLVYAAPPIWAPRTREASCLSTVPVRPGRLDRLQPDRTAARLRKKGPDATVKLPTTAPVSS